MTRGVRQERKYSNIKIHQNVDGLSVGRLAPKRRTLAQAIFKPMTFGCTAISTFFKLWKVKQLCV